MNKRKNESVANKVYSRIMRSREDHLWSYSDFNDLSVLAVAATLSRMTRRGDLRRIRKGLYYRSKKTVFGETRPSPDVITDVILENRHARTMNSGSSHYNRLGITTQVGGVLTRTTDRRMRAKGPGGISLHMVSRPLHLQKGIRPDERTVLDALRDVNHIPDATPEDVVVRLKTLFRSNKLKFGRLTKFAIAEPPRVRALLGAIGEDLKAEGTNVRLKDLECLRKSLNFLSAYRMPDISTFVRHAESWNIR